MWSSDSSHCHSQNHSAGISQVFHSCLVWKSSELETLVWDATLPGKSWLLRRSWNSHPRSAIFQGACNLSSSLSLGGLRRWKAICLSMWWQYMWLLLIVHMLWRYLTVHHIVFSYIYRLFCMWHMPFFVASEPLSRPCDWEGRCGNVFVQTLSLIFRQGHMCVTPPPAVSGIKTGDLMISSLMP